MKRFFLLVAALAAAMQLAGCATGDAQLRASTVAANIELSKKHADEISQPLVDLEIPLGRDIGGLTTGDGTLKLKVRNPAASMAPPQVQMPSDPWANVADRAVGVLGTAAGIYLGGEAAAGLAGTVASGIAGAIGTSHAGANAGISAVGQVAGTALTTQATAVSGALTAMPAPVVVEQPTPVVVEQPAPLVVTQPAPLVVQPSYGPVYTVTGSDAAAATPVQ